LTLLLRPLRGPTLRCVAAGRLQVAAPVAPQAEEEDEEMENLRARLDAVRS
jgi:hypothetical protein